MVARVLAGVTKHTITLFSDLTGCPKNFMREECVPYARLDGTVHHGDADAARTVTLVQDSVLLSFLVDKQGNTFVWKDGARRVRFGQLHWAGQCRVRICFFRRGAERACRARV